MSKIQWEYNLVERPFCEQLQKMGHEVQYFGMEHEGRCVGNRVNAYTSDMDFHGGSKQAM